MDLQSATMQMPLPTFQDLKFNFGQGVEFRVEALADQFAAVGIRRSHAAPSRSSVWAFRRLGAWPNVHECSNVQQDLTLKYSLLQDFPDLYTDPDAGPLYATPWGHAALFLC